MVTGYNSNKGLVILMANKALIVIDMQNELNDIENFDSVLAKINQRIDLFHKEHCPVIFMQHIDEEMPIASDAWQLVEQLHNTNEDTYFNKYQPDSFFNTGLENYLKMNQIKNIEICGAQTEYCVDTTIKVGFHLGFTLIVTPECFSTLNIPNLSAKQINAWYWKIWNNKFVNLN